MCAQTCDIKASSAKLRCGYGPSGAPARVPEASPGPHGTLIVLADPEPFYLFSYRPSGACPVRRLNASAVSADPMRLNYRVGFGCAARHINIYRAAMRHRKRRHRPELDPPDMIIGVVF